MATDDDRLPPPGPASPAGPASPKSASEFASGSSRLDDLSPITLPTLTTPKGGGAIRSIGETFRANAVTGTGSLAVALPLSPGRAGTGPKLSLSYDSGQGQSVFGMGWSADLPAISRRTDKELPRYRDAEESDEFVLSGAEVLVPALVQVGSAWQPDTLNDGTYEIVRYRPRVESAFARIEKRTDNVTGAVHWRTVTKDNVTSIFGRSPAAQVADPRQLRRIFRWLLEATFDDKGNVTWFEYKPEDTANVPVGNAEEKTRLAGAPTFANLHAKRIHYGNVAPLATTDPTARDLGALSWLFTVVFDYGDHDPKAPTPTETQTWPCRLDPFSTFRATFDVRTYRLCQRVLMFHTFAELGANPVLVRSLDLAYAPSPVATQLQSVTETGWMPATAGGYTTAAMPRLDLGYTPSTLQTTVQALDPASTRHIPAGIDGRTYRWLDLDGEGIPGVLTQQGGALSYARNEGGGQFVATHALRAKPNVASLGAPAQTLTSLDADGQLDLVLLGPAMHGFFERGEDSWSPFRRFLGAPNFNPADPNLRFLDLDGDGLADAVLAQDEAFVWSRSLGKDGFERPVTVRKPSDEDVGPTFVFADATESIFLADMTGDGMVDLVRIRNGEICYWPNVGYGHFGAKITMGAAPAFDRPEAFDPKRLRFGDIDGSGTADIAYVRPDGVAIYLNESGNRWSGPTLVEGIPGRSGTAIDLVDLLGTGTACLVWSSPEPVDAARPVRYVDLHASTKPYLLATVTNNLGLETQIRYASSTSFYLAARVAGSPWVTRLPFPVQVVASVQTIDAVQETRLVTTYSYKHGYFDGPEREYRGFGLVEQWDAEFYSAAHGEGLPPPGLGEQNDEFVLPPIHTKSWFDTGAWREARDLYAQYRREWYALDPSAPLLPDPILPGELSVPEAREAARARKGMLLRKEIYADDGTALAVHPYAIEEHRSAVEKLQPMGSQRHPVYFTHECESVARHYERNPTDPRVEHSFTLAVDAFGNVLSSAQVAYPRRVAAEPEQALLLATCAAATFVNETTAFYRVGVPVEAFSYELTGLTPPASGLFARADIDAAVAGAAPIAFDTPPTAGALQKRLLGDRRNVYLKDDLSAALPLGTVESRRLVYQVYSKALTATLVSSAFGTRVTSAMLTSEGGYVSPDGDWWRCSGIPTYDATLFYQAKAITDPFGNTASVVLDSYALLAVAAHSSDDPTIDNVIQVTNDYRVLRPSLLTDPNGNQTAVAFDELGMLVATAVMGKSGSPSGDTLANPTTRLEYDLLAWQSGAQPASVHTLAREKHGGTPVWQEAYTYSDGSGQEVLRKSQAEPDPSTGATRWIGTGRTVFDNKGNPVKKYEPYFAAGFNYEDEPSIVMQGVTPILRYDPLSRLVRTDFPDGTFETIELDPWGDVHADANDNVLESQWYANNTAATATAQQKRAAALAAQHAHTPTRRTADTLGRPFLVVEDNGTFGTYATRSALDIQGNVLSVTDARSNVALQQSFDMERLVLHSTSPDAGDRWSFPDVIGTAIRSWDGRGYGIRSLFDRIRRPTHAYVQPPGGTEILAERIAYGEAATGGGTANNLRGRKVLHFDGAGELYLSNYDLQGNLTATTRQLALTYTQTPDWSSLATLTTVATIQAEASSLLEAETFTTTTAFDALNRPATITTPDASVAIPTYNEANLLESLAIQIRGASTATPFVTNLDYNARGQRIQADYASGTSTTYTYDPLTFLLTEQATVRASDKRKLQDFSLTYDPVHNVVELDDNADQTLYFSGTIPVAGGGLYTYDPIYRLLSATGREHPAQQMPDETDSPLASLPHPNDTQALRAYTEQYEYDAVGNILQMLHKQALPAGGASGWTRHYQYPTASNRLQATSLPGDLDAGPYTGAYTYDANGNMTSMPGLAAMTWDHANRLQSVNLGGGGTSYYAYDATSTRARKVVHRTAALATERIYLGGYEVYRETSGTTVQAELQTLHVMDDKSRVAMAETETIASGAAIASPATQLRYQLTSHLQSSSIDVDQSGNAITYEEYFPFGATSFHSAEGGLEVSAKRYRYTGKERDDETGFYYFGARYYPPWLGRWVSTDPTWSADPYLFARNNPISRKDADGRDASPIGEFLRGYGEGIVNTALDLAKGAVEAQKTLLEPLPAPTSPPLVELRPEAAVHAARAGFDALMAKGRIVVEGVATPFRLAAQAGEHFGDAASALKQGNYHEAGKQLGAGGVKATAAVVSAAELGRTVGGGLSSLRGEAAPGAAGGAPAGRPALREAPPPVESGAARTAASGSPPTPGSLDAAGTADAPLLSKPEGPGVQFGQDAAARFAAQGKTGGAIIRPLAQELNAQANMSPMDKAIAMQAAANSQGKTFGAGPIAKMPNGDLVVTPRAANPTAPVVIVKPDGTVLHGNASVTLVDNNSAYRVSNVTTKP
jgi:RHS repeat-associated protein